MENFQINKIFDSTLLRPDATWDEITKFVDESVRYNVRGIAIPWYAMRYASQKVSNTDIRLIAGIDFPFGYSPLELKLREIDYYLSFDERITDFDVVVNISAVKSASWDYVKEEVSVVSQHIKDHERTCKIIVETCRLTEDEIERICEIVLHSPGVDYIKTGTGFGPRGTTLGDVRIIRSIVGDRKKVKVSGGVRTLTQVEEFLKLGVSLFGSSSATQIIDEFTTKQGGSNRCRSC
ncbi:MAG TPA: deoxyribose-phosphate aldolase [Pseudothermotoga sp.]|nr:deoxyribose-phosphate aldolase [Pseudothermotoga sp.]HOK83000.1 deoxyribose-phosphate aldolase [Pseudothermotoga sp.]HPP69831.1 deoxyribose-phosphate aldolase [Pseudothermotoga sp.]